MRKDLLFSPWRREGSEGPHCNIPVLKGQLQTGWKLSLHKGPHGEDKRQWVKVVLGEVSSQYKKEIIFSKNNHSSEQTPQGHCGVPITGGFQYVTG